MAKLLLREKSIYGDGSIMDLVVWGIPESEKYPDAVRYRLAFIARGGERPAVLYDNHYPKGHHKHIGKDEMPYHYRDIETLFKDFDDDVLEVRRENI